MLVVMAHQYRKKSHWRSRKPVTDNRMVEWRLVHPVAVVLSELLKACKSGVICGSRMAVCSTPAASSNPPMFQSLLGLSYNTRRRVTTGGMQARHKWRTPSGPQIMPLDRAVRRCGCRAMMAGGGVGGFTGDSLVGKIGNIACVPSPGDQHGIAMRGRGSHYRHRRSPGGGLPPHPHPSH